MKTIQRETLKQKLDADELQAVVDVLPPDSYEDYHIPNAVNVPVQDDSFDSEIQRVAPDKEKPVAVYCMNTACDASPKAAERMEALGYQNVLDYEAGKEDWKQAGYPVDS